MEEYNLLLSRTTKRRKVNKQEILSGGIASELLFCRILCYIEKNFAHRDQVQGDIVHEEPKSN
jgi:hypothetical protein